MSDKRLTDRQLLGEQGVALISLAVSRMGFVWRPTAVHDTGIDGEIELRDRGSGAVSGLLLKVQSKAVSNFDKDGPGSFEYLADRRDVDYWLGHNVPVILVLSKPNTGEVYWQPVQEPDGRVRPTQFKFDKIRDKLDETAASQLIELVRRGTPGARGFAQLKPERLLSNLLSVRHLPARLYLAETPFTTYKDVSKALEGTNISFEYSLRNKQVLTVRDLTDPRYEFLCDRGTVEDFPVEQWSQSDDPDAQRDFVRIVNQCLKQLLRTSKARVRLDPQTGTYYFPSNTGNTSYSFGYQGQKKSTSREVVKELRNKKLGHVMGFRHSAMWGKFCRYGKDWFLEITPTYFFTDPGGRKQSRLHPDWLAGIKRLEKNGAIRGQLVMWEELLSGQGDLFAEAYPFLAFNQLLSFDIEKGLSDAAWTANDEDESTSAEDLPAGLFDSL